MYANDLQNFTWYVGYSIKQILYQFGIDMGGHLSFRVVAANPV